MKTKILGYVVVNTLAFLSFDFARADSTDDFVNKYYPPLKANENDGTGQMGILSKFFKEVPTSSQAEVLARVLEKASNSTPPDVDLIMSILGISNGFQDHKINWNAHLKKLIYAQSKSADPNVRGMVVHLLAKADKDNARDLIISLLDDPDETVRCKALDGIDAWPDAESICEKYIQDHQGEESRSKSLKYAQDNLDAIHKQSK